MPVNLDCLHVYNNNSLVSLTHLCIYIYIYIHSLFVFFFQDILRCQVLVVDHAAGLLSPLQIHVKCQLKDLVSRCCSSVVCIGVVLLYD